MTLTLFICGYEEFFSVALQGLSAPRPGPCTVLLLMVLSSSRASGQLKLSDLLGLAELNSQSPVQVHEPVPLLL